MAIDCGIQTLQDLSEGDRSTGPQNTSLEICYVLASLAAALVQNYIVKPHLKILSPWMELSFGL